MSISSSGAYFAVYVNLELKLARVPSYQLEEAVFSLVTQFYGKSISITWRLVE